MRVAHIITGLDDGGAEAALFRLVCADRTNNCRHIVISLGGPGKYGPLLESRGITVHCLGLRRSCLSLAAVVRLASILHAQKLSCVQTWMYHANLVGGVVARITGVKKVFWGLHNASLHPTTSKRSTRLVNWLCARLSHTLPTTIIGCADKTRQVHVAQGYAAHKFKVIANGYDLTAFTPNATARARLRTQWGIAPRTPVLGLVARWDAEKDHANLIMAVAQARLQEPGIQLVLVGSDCEPGNTELAALLQKAGLTGSVHCLGPRQDIPAVMNALDLHVLSSRSEAFPNVVAEAMACGTPCVATDVGDAAIIIEGTGWICPPGAPQTLATAICEAITQSRDRDRWVSRQRAARTRIAETFSIEQMVSNYHATWSTA